MSKLDDVIANNLRGDGERFKTILLNKDRLLSQFCEHAERVAKKRRLEPWSIISDITSHGSGVSSAIYDLYRDAGEDPQPVNLTADEKKVLDAAADAWNAYIELTKGEGEDPDETRTVRDAIHSIQRVIALRVARRVDPEVWRC